MPDEADQTRAASWLELGNKARSQTDSTKTINKVIQGYLEQLSEVVKDCTDRDEVMTAVRYIFDTNFPDVVEDVYASSTELEKAVAASAMVYATPPVYKRFKHPSYSGGNSPVLRVNGHLIGLDKIDHFLSHGFMYYRRYSEKTENGEDGRGTVKVLRTDTKEIRINDALDVGLFQEESTWGLSGTGIKSYGDLAANYNGLNFYMKLFETEDILKCENKKFKVVGEFTIKDYVDDSWDESINCSSFDSDENMKTVRQNMKQMGFEKCPIDEKKCEELVVKYKSVAKKMLHPLCRDKDSQHTQVEKPRNKIISFFQLFEYIDTRDLGRAARGAK